MGTVVLPTVFELTFIEFTGVFASMVLLCSMAAVMFGAMAGFCFFAGILWTVISPAVIRVAIENNRRRLGNN